MAYKFPPDVEQLIRAQMAAGVFSTEDDLLRAALRALDDEQRATIDEDPEVVAGIGRGLEQLQRGLGRPFDEFDAEFRAAGMCSNASP